LSFARISGWINLIVGLNGDRTHVDRFGRHNALFSLQD
jgi:hypothetical protein